MSATEPKRTPMDSFSVGQWVMSIEPIVRDMQVQQDFSGDTAVLAAQVDHSFTNHPHEIVAVDLPFVMLELDGMNAHGKRQRVAVNTREWKLRVCSPEFVDAWKATLPAPEVRT